MGLNKREPDVKTEGDIMADRFRYIYGPVPSWRVGSSLGIDLLSQEDKICSLDCIYCQLGRTTIHTKERKTYIPEELIIKEIDMLPHNINIDYITLSGRGEPTLALNMGNTVRAIKKARKERIAIITNSTLINHEDVQEELSSADFIIAKLDVSSSDLFEKVNKPAQGIEFDVIVQGLKDFKKRFHGRFALQIMFMGKNSPYANDIANIAREINPDEIQINTPLRPCGVDALGAEEISVIKNLFAGLPAISVYEGQRKQVEPISHKDTLKRRGKI